MIILGLACFYHDASASLLRDGKLIAAAEEERFTRRKHDSGFPAQAVAYCLKEAGCTIDDVDHIIFYEKPLLKFDRILETILAEWPRSLKPWLAGIPRWLVNKLHMGNEMQQLLGTDKPVLFCEHHLSHAASAFLVSPYDEAAVMSVDGVGEWTSTAWGVGRGSAVSLRQHLRFPHSVGLLFSTITAYLGFRVNDAEWKVMGLAPYGEPRFVDKFREVVDIREDGSIRLDLRYFSHTYSTDRMFTRRWEQLFGQPQRHKETELTDFHRDIAHSGQKVIEEIMVTMARHVQKQTGLKRLCLAGGVGLNSVANWRILQDTPFEEMYIQPAAGDSGGSLGAALYLQNTVLKHERCFEMQHAYWGPGFSDQEIAETLRKMGAAVEVLPDEQAVLQRTAGLIAEGKVIGWFQGRMEFGPRALGARSIVADPRNPAMKDIINAKVKFREAFRPFAPSVLKQHAHEYFAMPAGMDMPFMLQVPAVLADKRAVIPAVTHADGTGRVQTVTEVLNGRYYRLIEAFGRITGVPVVINTSFNVRGEPIVCTPADAYRTFLDTGIDALVAGLCVVTNKERRVDFEAGFIRSVALEASPVRADNALLD